nr:sulfite exporter TauE/SafE family protein [Halomonas socia]
MSEPLTLLIIGLTFLLGGAVKGVIGMGMPTIALALLTASVGLPAAVALMLVPTFVTNVWQALVGGQLKLIVVRLWPFLVAALVAIWPGVTLLARLDPGWLSTLLGVLIVTYALLNLWRRQSLSVRHERRAGVACGVVNGLLTGMTGSSVFPGVPYLLALGLPREVLIQAMGVLFTFSTLVLAVSMGGQRLLDAELAGLSALAVLPALLGMRLGRRLRPRLSEQAFRRCFFMGLLLLGGYLILG